MSPDLDKKLVEKYPLFFSQRHRSMQETCMCWGFECGDGWYNLIDEAAAKIEKINSTLPNGVYFSACQIKQKFGTIRIYIDPPACQVPQETAKAVDAAVDEAEDKSSKTCEICGNPGEEESNRGWISTVCLEHSHISEKDPIVRFYLHHRPSKAALPSDRFWLSEFLDTEYFVNDDIEHKHDFIQWIFPLDEPSMFNQNAPLVTAETIDKLSNSLEFKTAFMAVYDRMLDFYGLYRSTNGPEFAKTEEILIGNETRVKEWFRPRDHNMLRISRILRSLCLFGFRQHAIGLRTALQGLIKNEKELKRFETSITYWDHAIRP